MICQYVRQTYLRNLRNAYTGSENTSIHAWGYIFVVLTIASLKAISASCFPVSSVVFFYGFCAENPSLSRLSKLMASSFHVLITRRSWVSERKRLIIVFTKCVTKITSQRSKCNKRRMATIFSERQWKIPLTWPKKALLSQDSKAFFFVFYHYKLFFYAEVDRSIGIYPDGFLPVFLKSPQKLGRFERF